MHLFRDKSSMCTYSCNAHITLGKRKSSMSSAEMRRKEGTGVGFQSLPEPWKQKGLPDAWSHCKARSCVRREGTGTIGRTS